MTRLMRHRIRNIQPYQYKEALEEMYAEWKEFDAICNSEFLPAFEDTGNTDENEGNKDTTDITSQTRSKVDENKKNNANTNKSFQEKLKAMGKAIADLVSKVVGWFSEKIGKLDMNDQEFLKRLDKAKSNNIQKARVTTYMYDVACIKKSVVTIDQEFQKVSTALSEMFDKYDDARSMGEKANDDEIMNKMDVSSTALKEILDASNLDIRADYYKELLGKCGVSNNDTIADTTAFMEKWEGQARGPKYEAEDDNENTGLQLQSPKGKEWITNCENFLRGGLEDTIKTLKQGITHIQNSQKNTSALISSAIRGEVHTQKSNERMQKILNSYDKYLSFAAMFYKTAYKITIEARENFKLVLQKAYNFT